MRRLPALVPVSLPLLLAACLGGGGGGGVATFTSFADIGANDVVDIPSATAINYNGDIVAGEIDGTNQAETGSSTARLTVDQNADQISIRLSNSFPDRGDVVTEFTDPPVGAGTNDELTLSTRTDGVDPTDRLWVYQGPNGVLPFNYMTFGIWELDIGGNTDLGGAAWGAPTAAASVAALTGAAVVYTGRLLGTQIQAGLDPTGPYRFLEADATITANFDANTIALASTNTREVGQVGAVALDIVTTTPGDIAGNSFGANGIVRIVGALGSTEGTFGGQFFGPAAEEVGGWFNIDNINPGNSDRYFGSFGALEGVP